MITVYSSGRKARAFTTEEVFMPARRFGKQEALRNHLEDYAERRRSFLRSGRASLWVLPLSALDCALLLDNPELRTREGDFHHPEFLVGLRNLGAIKSGVCWEGVSR